MKKSARAKAVEAADRYFSMYIRQREADARGNTSCKTCGKEGHWTEFQCGHFQSRVFYRIRWDERNAACQCGSCNMRSGQQYLMGLWLNKTFGQGTAEEMIALSIGQSNIKTREIQEIAAFFKQKVAL